MILLWLTTVFPPASTPSCLQSGDDDCKTPPTSTHLAVLYTSFALMSIGAGGIRSSSLAFGADQLNLSPGSKDPNGNIGSGLEQFIRWYYASIVGAAIVAVTCVAYIQENAGWIIGFGVPVVLMFLSAFCFFLASPFYVKVKVECSLLTRFAQVIATAYRNRNIDTSYMEASGTFYCSKEMKIQEPSPKLRFLNKACFIPKEPPYQLLVSEDMHGPDPWRLCPMDQVEELKSLITILPIWSTGIIMGVVYSQNSLTVLQAASMDRHLGPSFEIPAGSFTFFTVLAILLLVSLYQTVILPLASWIMGRPVHLSPKIRMGIGLMLSAVALSMLALTECARREQAAASGPPMSAMWMIPYYVIIGLGEGLNAIAQNEFYYSRLPKSMSSVASNLVGLGGSLASVFSSFTVSAVDFWTSRGGKESWVSSNINNGHYDYYYWVIVALSLANFGYFLACCRAYEPHNDGKGDVLEKGEARAWMSAMNSCFNLPQPLGADVFLRLPCLTGT
ncbi:hypothetical protein CRG98_018940 [Punica granatum]|uniref:Protein NRT1/ PTR FAMILY 1.2-like n=1 Tax=Punica granatum TaxID=22663 RepID=A0A2I0JXX8_PUNGR|nr:hypothetical protein CRG98_018940 [Punica granatum]